MRCKRPQLKLCWSRFPAPVLVNMSLLSTSTIQCFLCPPRPLLDMHRCQRLQDDYECVDRELFTALNVAELIHPSQRTTAHGPSWQKLGPKTREKTLATNQRPDLTNFSARQWEHFEHKFATMRAVQPEEVSKLLSFNLQWTQTKNKGEKYGANMLLYPFLKSFPSSILLVPCRVIYVTIT